MIVAGLLAAVAWAGSAPLAAAPSQSPAEPPGSCRPEAIRRALDEGLATLGEKAPGGVAAVYVPSRFAQPVATAAGYSDLEAHRPMKASDRMLAGSVGKTLFAAMALQLAGDGSLDLDRPIAAYLRGADLPNADQVTARMLLSHRTGYPDLDAAYMADLVARPMARRNRSDWFAIVQRSPPTGAPGLKYEYSDVNFLVLAEVIEGATGKDAYALIQSRLLSPLGLNDIIPADRPRLPRLAAGYAGKQSVFGRDKLMSEGALLFNPQFEWGGGGFASTAADLSRWIASFRSGRAFPARLWPDVVRPAELGPDRSDYGLGIHVDLTKAGPAFGHGGYMPGYFSWVRWYENGGFAIALQVNTSDRERLARKGYDVIDDVALRVAQLCPATGR